MLNPRFQLEEDAGKTVELGPDGHHDWNFFVAAGRYIRVEIDQQGIDIIARLFVAGNPESILEEDRLNGEYGTEILNLLANQDTTYRIEVEATSSRALPGGYRVRLVETREALVEDHQRINAAQLFDRAERLRRAGNEPSLKQALLLYQQSFVAFNNISAWSDSAQALSMVGWIQEMLGHRSEAREAYIELLALYRLRGGLSEQARTVNRLGSLDLAEGKILQAEKLFGEALELAEATEDVPVKAAVIGNLAAAKFRREDLAGSLELFMKVKSIWLDLGRPRELGTALQNISQVLRALGRIQDSIDALEEARAHRVVSRDIPELAALLLQLGDLHLRIGDLAGAERDFKTALDLGASQLPGELAVLLANNLALVHAQSGEKQSAITLFEQAIESAQRLGLDRHLAMAQLNLSALYGRQGRFVEAHSLVQSARKTFRSLGDPRNMAACSFVEGLIERGRGHREESLKHLESAVSEIESLRSDQTGWNFRITFFSTIQTYYEELVDLLIEMYRLAGEQELLDRAFLVAEKRKARSLLDAMAEIRMAPASDPELLQREKRLTALLASVEAQIVQVSESDRQALELERRKLLVQIDSAQAEILRGSSEYQKLSRPQPLEVAEIRRQVLDADTRLLVYTLGEHRSFLFVVDREAPIQAYDLPARSIIDETVDSARLALRSGHWDATHAALLDRLSDLVLGPVAASLDARRLAIVADGSLQNVPFSALTEPGPLAQGQSRPWLLEAREVVHLPSASFLAASRRRSLSRPRGRFGVVVFADPVFSLGDSRLSESKASHVADGYPEELRRTLRDINFSNDLPRLRGTAREADAIRKIVAPEDLLIETGFEANRATFDSLDLDQFRVLHFATHGLLNSAHPELSGLVLSLFDKRGKPVNGYLKVFDLFRRPIGADLVVLSACRTGLGSAMQGEGLLGLPWGFLNAGAARAVVSLWDVDDDTTAIFMEHFYAWLGRRLSPSAALRKAQLAVLKNSLEARSKLGEDAGTSPADWAAFILLGDWLGIEEVFRSYGPDLLGGTLIIDPAKGAAYDQEGSLTPLGFVNGIDGETGQLLAEMPNLSAVDRLVAADKVERLRHWVRFHRPDDLLRLPMFGIDPEDLSQAGWGILFAPGVPNEARKALEPLIELRKQQAGQFFYQAEIDPSFASSALSFLEQRGLAFGPARPEALPYYLLLVGDPEMLPFNFQSQLDIQYAVGRIHFDDVADYRRYAESLVRSDYSKDTRRPALFWGSNIEGDPNSQWMIKGLLEPLHQEMLRWRRSRGLYEIAKAPDGRRSTLINLLTRSPPAFLFTASHGVTFSGEQEKRRYQGSLVGEEWNRSLGPPRREHFLSGEDLGTESHDLAGLIAFHFACYSAGCSHWDDFADGIFRGKLAEGAFVSHLSKKLLACGAQAVVGHVDRAWETSFAWNQNGDQTPVFVSVLRQLLAGHRLGHAMEWVHFRYAECATYLNQLNDQPRLEASQTKLAGRIRLAALDAAKYLLIGDPAVRLAGAEHRSRSASQEDNSTTVEGSQS